MTKRAKPGWDVIVVGAGPAGLAAALMLGRCRHRVLVLDTGQPRNKASHGMHGYLTREGMAPANWLLTARKEVLAYGVEFREEEVTHVERKNELFTVRISGTRSYATRKVLIATGVCDNVPQIPGLAGMYGISVFHCPYCDGWEMRDRPLAAYGKGSHAVPLALNLRTWSTDVMLFTDGPHAHTRRERALLLRAGITVCTTPVAALEGARGALRKVVLDDGTEQLRAALFFSTGHRAHCTVPNDLGCELARTGEVITDLKQRTHIPGFFVAGDAAIDTHMVSVATAEGAKAAITIHTELRTEDGWG